MGGCICDNCGRYSPVIGLVLVEVEDRWGLWDAAWCLVCVTVWASDPALTVRPAPDPHGRSGAGGPSRRRQAPGGSLRRRSASGRLHLNGTRTPPVATAGQALR